MYLRTNFDKMVPYFDKMSQEISHVEFGKMARGVIIDFFNDVLNETPQWSGDLVASWRLIPPATSDAAGSSSKSITPGEIAKGSEKGIDKAKKANQGFNDYIPPFKSFVNLVNSQPYSVQVEENWKSYLREPNQPGHAVARAVLKLPKNITLTWVRDFYKMKRL